MTTPKIRSNRSNRSVRNRLIRPTVKLAAVAALTAGFASGPMATAQAALPLSVDGQPVPSLAPMIKRVSPAVVNISVRGSVDVQRNNPLMNDPFFRRFFNVPENQGPTRRETMSAGSGVIVDSENGYIITNHHVVANADEIEVVLLDRRSLEAKVVGSDPQSDIAVIQVDAKDLTAIEVANSDVLEVGDFVVAIGNPFGFSHTVTSGIVSGLGRSGLDREAYEDFIQTDAAINPGNSGGALINLRGELIGVNSAIVSNSGGNLGIGFAIPSNMAASIMEQLLSFGEIRRGRLGVEIQNVGPETAAEADLTVTEGALVSQVQPESAAEKAGIKIWDVIVKVDRKTVDDALGLRNLIGLKRPGDEVEIELIRDGKTKRITATLDGATTPARVASGELHQQLRGAELRDIPDDDPDYRNMTGVLIAEVESGTPAALRGLRAGDVITHVNRKRVRDLNQLQERIDDGDRLFLTVRRGEMAMLVQIG